MPGDAIVRANLDAAQDLSKQGRFTEALVVLDHIHSVTIDPRAAYAKAQTLYSLGRYWEAHRLYVHLLDAGFGASDFIEKLGWSYLCTGDARKAERYMRELVAKRPDDWRSHFGLGESLRAREPREAKVAFNKALELSPSNPHCLINLGACELALRNWTAAENVVRLVFQESPHEPAAWANLGLALLEQRRFSEACEAFGQAEQASSDASEDTSELSTGSALRLMGQPEAAIDYYESTLADHPSASAHADYALALLSVGRLEEGFEQFEFRWMELPLLAERARYAQPAWNGQDLVGKKLLVRCEQGAGDIFQFVRYLPLLKSRGATVLLDLHRDLGDLPATFPGADAILRRGDPLPEFDYYVDLMSLPKVLGTTLQRVPASARYLEAPEAKRRRWKSRFAGLSGIKIGIVWAGDPKHPRDQQRSIDVSTLDSLFSVSGIQWISLQKGAASEQLHNLPPALVVDLGSELEDYGDTAAVLETLDLVVTVDTSVAHLAGAVGTTVWVLIPYVADWRWLQNGDGSPWYPTMRLFRQRRPDDWMDVIEEVANALRDFTNGREKNLALTPSANRTSSDEPHPRHSRASRVPAISRVCRTRIGMIQYFPDRSRLSRSIQYYGEFLHAQLDAISRLAKTGAVIAEAGAGIGFYSIALAASVKAEGQVLAIERSRVLRRILLQNLTANETAGITIIPAAGCDVCLDDLSLDRLDMLLISNQGYAKTMIQGGQKTLWRHRPAVVSMDVAADHFQEYLSNITDLGYRCWCIESPLFNPSNFNHREDDIFAEARSFALIALPEERELPMMPAACPSIRRVS